MAETGLPPTFWPALFAAVAAIFSAVVAYVTFRTHARRASDDISPYLVFDGWSYEDGPENWYKRISIRTVKNKGKGIALHLFGVVTAKPSREGFNNDFPSEEDMRRLVRNPVAYRYEHTDGLKCTMVLLGGLIQDFNFAAHIEGRPEIFSTQMYLPMPPGRTSLANFFSPLVNNFEKMYLTGKATYPVERTLLTTGLTAAGVESLFRNQVRYDTPHLAIEYQTTRESTFWRT